jgi:hypothetical protein
MPVPVPVPAVLVVVPGPAVVPALALVVPVVGPPLVFVPVVAPEVFPVVVVALLPVVEVPEPWLGFDAHPASKPTSVSAPKRERCRAPSLEKSSEAEGEKGNAKRAMGRPRCKNVYA